MRKWSAKGLEQLAGPCGRADPIGLDPLERRRRPPQACRESRMMDGSGHPPDLGGSSAFGGLSQSLVDVR